MNAGSLPRDCSCSYSSQETHLRTTFRKPNRTREAASQHFQSRHRSWFTSRTQHGQCDLTSVGAADLSADVPQEPDDEPPVISQVFPRIREGNPYRRLGISEEASFEEAQEARNFLYEAYKHHEASREAIELAYDKILKTAFKRREKFGFRPPRTGRRTDVQGDAIAPTILERVKDSIEPAVGIGPIVNDGSIFMVLGMWAGWQAEVTDPAFPVALALGYSAYKFFSKRKNRNPDGPFFGGSPIWGALAMTGVALALGALVSNAILWLLPLPPQFPPQSVGLFVLCAIVGLFTLFFR